MLKKNNFQNLKTLFDIVHVANCLNEQGTLDGTSKRLKAVGVSHKNGHHHFSFA